MDKDHSQMEVYTQHGFVGDQKREYLIKFDPAIGMAPIWINANTLNLFNTHRDNIFMTSSAIDMVLLS